MSTDTTQPEMIVRAIAPWFGGKRTMAPDVVEQIGPHTQYFEPFCGSMAVLFAKEPSQKETVNDMHGDLTNLALILQELPTAAELYDRLQRVICAQGLLERARQLLETGTELDPVERAYWYFLTSWMGRNGTAGTARQDYQIAVRWTNNGGSPTVRFRNAVESIPAWHERLKNVVILRRNAFDIIDRFEDEPGTAIYADPPYAWESRSNSGGGGKYLHEFNHETDHDRLAEILKRYRKARVVVSYYDCERIRQL